MLKYAEIVNEETKVVNVGLGTNSAFYRSIGMTKMEVEQAYNGFWYVKGFTPEKPVETKQAEVRAVRNSYLEKYVDPKQLVMVWDGLSEEEKQLYANYRTYLLDYTELEGWYLEYPKTLDEWKMTLVPEETETVVEEEVEQPTEPIENSVETLDV